MLATTTLLFLLLRTALGIGQPVYQYSYQPADVLQPVVAPLNQPPPAGYRRFEGGYFPSEIGQTFGAGNLQAAYHPSRGLRYEKPPITLIKPIVNGQTFNVPLANGLRYLDHQGFAYGQSVPFAGSPVPFAGSPVPFAGSPVAFAGSPVAFGGPVVFDQPRLLGSEDTGKSDFSEAKKSSNGEEFRRGKGAEGEEVKHGQAGFDEKEVASKDVKGDSGYYSNVDGSKKVYEDGKEYRGGRHFNNEGQNAKEQTAKQGHKKGHKIKSFKTSHHKDESGKDEEYYDEAHDEGGNFNFKGESGTFGENSANSFKGSNQEGKYKAGESKQEGLQSSEHSVHEAGGSKGKYGGSKFAGNEASYGYKNGADEQSLLGHQEAGKVFKTSPFIAPFHDN